MTACLIRTLGLIQLALTPLVLSAALANVWMARRFRARSWEAQAVSERAALLSARVLDRASPFLECDNCGATLDPRTGIAMAVDGVQLQLHCGTCAEQVPTP